MSGHWEGVMEAGGAPGGVSGEIGLGRALLTPDLSSLASASES